MTGLQLAAAITRRVGEGGRVALGAATRAATAAVVVVLVNGLEKGLCGLAKLRQCKPLAGVSKQISSFAKQPCHGFAAWDEKGQVRLD